jgi:hypothetical protein
MNCNWNGTGNLSPHERTTDKTMAERTTDKTMAERKRTEEQTTIYKTYV